MVRCAVFAFLRKLGPGLVTGASDDDPSGIATYAVAGASLGYSTLWTAVLTLPLMVAVQLVCARIGMVSGVGLTGALRRHYPRSLLYAICVLLLTANIFNIGADLGGMADAVAMLSGAPRLISLLLTGSGEDPLGRHVALVGTAERRRQADADKSRHRVDVEREAVERFGRGDTVGRVGGADAHEIEVPQAQLQAR